MHVVAPVVVQLCAASVLMVGVAVATYTVIGPPPSDAGALHVTVAVDGPVASETMLGAVGGEPAGRAGPAMAIGTGGVLLEFAVRRMFRRHVMATKGQ